MTARWSAFGVWLAVAASLLFWGLRLFVPGTPVPAHTGVVSTAAGLHGDLARLFGAEEAPEEVEIAPPPSRFRLVGVVAPRGDAGTREGVALIAVDGKPPKAYRVGATVDEGLVLQAVHARAASLGPKGGAARVSLEIPPPAPPATGQLPGAGAAPGLPLLAPRPIVRGPLGRPVSAPTGAPPPPPESDDSGSSDVDGAQTQ